MATFIDYVALMLLNTAAGFALVGGYIAWGYTRPEQRHWAPAFAAVRGRWHDFGILSASARRAGMPRDHGGGPMHALVRCGRVLGLGWLLVLSASCAPEDEEYVPARRRTADADTSRTPDPPRPQADADADGGSDEASVPACDCDLSPACDYDCACDPDCPCACDGSWLCDPACGCDPECDPAYGSCAADGICNVRCTADYPDPDCSAGDPGVDAGCPYPPGPDGLYEVGMVAPPMAWPAAAWSSESLPPDFAVLHCEAGVNGIFLQVVTLSCSYCPERLLEIAGLRWLWDETGTKWIFLVADAPDAATADAYVASYGIDFGWRTNDADNTAGAYLVTGSGVFEGVPWTGVIAASDMVFRYDQPDDALLDIAAIASELAGG